MGDERFYIHKSNLVVVVSALELCAAMTALGVEACALFPEFWEWVVSEVLFLCHLGPRGALASGLVADFSFSLLSVGLKLDFSAWSSPLLGPHTSCPRPS